MELIDRQAAIDAARDWYEGLICGSFKGLEKRLRALPSSQPDVLACGSGELVQESDSLVQESDSLVQDCISRQAAITAICEDGTWLERQGCTEITMCERKQRDADILSELPTIDAVEVVRCKDCINFTKGKDEWGSCFENQMKMWRETDFCSWGERRDDAD